MSTVSMPVSRPVGRALVVAGPSARAVTLAILQQLGYACGEVDDPYAALLELCRRPTAYQSVILGLGSLYREELAVVTTVKQRFPQVEVWLTQTDGRPAAMAEAVRLGADGLLGEDGLHRIAMTAAAPVVAQAVVGPPVVAVSAASPARDDRDEDVRLNEPILSAEELRALLQELPSSSL
jgi:DNA-binding NarL/FixJ family response regulator